MFVGIPSRHSRAVRWATPLLVVASVTAFVLMLRPETDAARQMLLLRWGTLSGALPEGFDGWLDAFMTGRILSLVTALFIHADWVHLVGNLVFLLIFGLPAERVMGSLRFLVLFVLGGALANLAAAALMASPNHIIIGSSGGVSAVIGAYLALFPTARLGIVVPLGLFLEFVRVPAFLLIGLWALIQGIFTTVGPAFGAVAWWAHVAGFAFGIVFALSQRAAVARRLRTQYR